MSLNLSLSLVLIAGNVMISGFLMRYSLYSWRVAYESLALLEEGRIICLIVACHSRFSLAS